jgi:transposase
VADVARLHGLNANQVFNWRRRMVARSAAAAKATPPVECVAADAVPAASVAGFVPVGMFVQTDDRHAPAALSTVAPPTAGHVATDARMGMIEIDLTCGTRLRVDAFVNERALRRVLSVLKAMP